MRNLSTLVFFAFSALVTAQNFPVGTSNITFYDADRERDIGTVVHYPAVMEGMDTEVAMGEFPVLVFGHGFLMAVTAYNNIRDHFVPRGYILVLPTTEGGFADHAAFGEDLSFLAQAFQEEGQDLGSVFNGHVAPGTALMGHSMGGGASVLGAAGNDQIQTVVNFAAAETNPSAIAAAADILVPTLMFAGSLDCVTPPAVHQQPIYDALQVDCKSLVSIIGGGHCYFANANLACDFGESTCTPSPTITREAHQDVVNDIATLWLDGILKNDQAAYNMFLDSITTSTRVDVQSTCISTGIHGEMNAPAMVLHPVPASQTLWVTGLMGPARLQVFDTNGRSLFSMRSQGGEMPLDVSDLPNGVYHLLVEQGDRRSTGTFVVMH